MGKYCLSSGVAVLLAFLLITTVIDCEDELSCFGDELPYADAKIILQSIEDQNTRIGLYSVREALALDDVSLDQCRPYVIEDRHKTLILYSSKRAGRKVQGLSAYLFSCLAKLATYCLDHFSQAAEQLVAPRDMENLALLMNEIGANSPPNSISKSMVAKAYEAYRQQQIQFAKSAQLAQLEGDDIPEVDGLSIERNLISSCKSVIGLFGMRKKLFSISLASSVNVDENPLETKWPGVQQACRIFLLSVGALEVKRPPSEQPRPASEQSRGPRTSGRQ